MSRIERAITAVRGRAAMSTRVSPREAIVVIVEETPLWSSAMRELCDYLDVRIIHLSCAGKLPAILRDNRPMAVLAGMEGAEQDGCHIMKIVAAHDPELPTMIVTNGDAAMAGAAEAVGEIWGLTSVFLPEENPGPGDLAEFLFQAGRRGRCLGLLPV